MRRLEPLFAALLKEDIDIRKKIAEQVGIEAA